MKKRKVNKAKRVDNQCGNNGNCPHCRRSRLYQVNKETQKAEQMMEEYIIVAGTKKGLDLEG
jgi:uncharacterized protein (DUF983 family)